jgi:pimeloyl-ACP methyl ester carboxylesterase
MSFKKKITTIDGQKTFYWEKNPEKKEIMVVLHGFPGSHGGLLDMANGMGKYRFIVPDLPACGLSEPLKDKHNLENYSKWLKGFLESLSIEQPIIVGHSFGSRLALVFSGANPEMIRKLVLITPVVKVEGLIARFVSIEYRIAKILPQHLQKSWLSNRVHFNLGHKIIFKSAGIKKRQKLIASDRDELGRLNPQVNIELFDEFYRFSLIPVGQKVKTESLVIAGELDEIAPLASVRKLAEQLSNSQFVIMKNCGHIVVAEKPLTVAKIILNWLS